MRTNGLANWLTRASAAVTALALSAAAGCAISGARNDDRKSSTADLAGMVAATSALYKSVDDASADAYRAQAFAVGTKPQMSQPCFMPDNRKAARPTVLANPPYPAASIAQRERAVAVLGAYAEVLAAVVQGSSSADAASAASDLQQAAVAFVGAADRHQQGDLFVDELAATLNAGARRIASENLESRERAIVELAPAINKLAGILRADEVRAKDEALAASALEEQRWLAFANRGATPSGVSSESLPSCFEPAIPPLHSIISAAPSVSSSASAAVAADLARTRSRETALQSLNVGDFFSKYLALDQAAVSALSGGDATGFAVAITRADVAAVNAQTSASALPH